MDFEMMCESLVRKIFQCSRGDDPIGRLANADNWSGIHGDELSIRHKCQAWSTLCRLKSEYLDSVLGREELYAKSRTIEEKILAAGTNKELREAMSEINRIVEKLKLSEFPYINYKNTNDKKINI